jgi:hypothetical protein
LITGAGGTFGQLGSIMFAQEGELAQLSEDRVT